MTKEGTSQIIFHLLQTGGGVLDCRYRMSQYSVLSNCQNRIRTDTEGVRLERRMKEDRIQQWNLVPCPSSPSAVAAGGD